MDLRRIASPFLLFAPLAFGAAGCMHETEFTHFDGTIQSDGYALFEVQNDRAQEDDVVVHVRDVDPGTRYVLLYTETAPESSGWFKLDPSNVSRCGGSPGPHCDVGDGFGFMVDVVTVPEGANEIVLRHGVCGCGGGDRDERRHRRWSAYYGVMRVERTGKTQFVKVEVTAREVDGYAETPTIHQLQ